LLKALDDRLGLTQRLTASLADRRQADKVQHELIELVRPRVYGIACGYADCNDAARLAQDPVRQVTGEGRQGDRWAGARSGRLGRDG
jgi:Transposase DDE domain group 1